VTSEPVFFGVSIRLMVHMILILPKVTAHTINNRLLNNTGAISFTIKVLVNSVFVEGDERNWVLKEGPKQRRAHAA
jgi:hypothetical protein